MMNGRKCPGSNSGLLSYGFEYLKSSRLNRVLESKMNALVILLSSLMFLMSLALFVYTKKQLTSLQQSIQFKIHTNQVNSELTALNAGSFGLGERFIKLEKQMQQMAARIDEVSSEMSNNSPYAYAIELALKATPAENIAELCHISLTEAQLLVMMHQQQAA